jgi:triacylglycerol lipase
VPLPAPPPRSPPAPPHRVYLVAGMFGFGRLAGFEYFHHVRSALEARFRESGQSLVVEIVPCSPTASIRHRARILARTVEQTAGDDDGPIHLLGHSTGGLDLRLLLSPGVTLGIDPARLAWRARVRTALSLNTPHYGTPLATYFSTVAGTRLLYGLSLLTVVSLALTGPSLDVLSRLIGGVGDLDRVLGGDLRLLSRYTDGVLRFMDPGARGELEDYLRKMRADQGGVIQITPEAMDLFNASTGDAPGVRYGSIATAAPPPSAIRLVERLRSPQAAITASMYSTLYRFAGQPHEMYPYARPTERQEDRLAHAIPRPVTERSSDGIVPTLSMLHGELVWCGEADHLDVLGHFHDDGRPRRHTDWITTGARFTRRRFAEMLDAVAGFLLDA